ncbi:MAG: hypothetical protein PHF51_05510 [Candidatus ainarchaeum sp.]|nr:hypothetical protein [Candidatus ainarchaeum sp.]
MGVIELKNEKNGFHGLPPQKEPENSKPKRSRRDKVRLSGYKGDELVRVFCNTFGCTVRASSSGAHTRGHATLTRMVGGETITFHVPLHGEIPRDTVAKIIKDSGMTVREFGEGVRKR